MSCVLRRAGGGMWRNALLLCSRVGALGGSHGPLTRGDLWMDGWMLRERKTDDQVKKTLSCARFFLHHKKQKRNETLLLSTPFLDCLARCFIPLLLKLYGVRRPILSRGRTTLAGKNPKRAL
jgi:hypothetical protein